MKIFLAFVALVMLVALVWLLFPDMEIDRATKASPPPPPLLPGPAATAAPAPIVSKQDFKSIIAALQDDMNKIPQALSDPRYVPVHAFTVRSQVHEVLNQHAEYQALNQVCELIIRADQEHSQRQVESQRAQGRVYTSPLDDAHYEQITKARREVVRKAAEDDWVAFRLKTGNEVERELGALATREL